MQLDYTDLVVEMQSKFDEIEGMIKGLLYEQNQPGELLDDEAILSTIQSMVLETRLQEESEKLEAENQRSVSFPAKVQQYQKDFNTFQEKNSKAMTEYQNVQTLQVRTVLDDLSSHKNEIISQTLIEIAKLLQKLSSVSRNDINDMFNVALMKNIKNQIHNFIMNFH